MDFKATIILALMTCASCQHLSPSHAAETKMAEAGEVPPYVEAICGDCHAVRANGISPNPQAPGFADIANSPGITHDTLVAFLSDAHNYPLQMDVDLDREDIETIADYVITLQSEEYRRTPS